MIGIGAYRTIMDYTRYVLFYMLRGMPCLGCIEFEYRGVHVLYPICFIAREGRAKHTFGAIYTWLHSNPWDLKTEATGLKTFEV